MNMFSIIILTVISILFAVWWRLNTKIPSKFPPGPPRYPLVGSIPYIVRKNKSFTHGLFESIKKYGKLVGFYMGSKPFVVIADYGLLKDLLKREEVAGRPPIAPLHEFRPGHKTLGPDNEGRMPGVLRTQGPYWREQRRFLLRNLRDFGFGKSEMEDAMLDEIEKLSIELQKNIGKPKPLDNTLNLAIANTLWSLLAGETLPLNDPTLMKVVNDVCSFIKEASQLTYWTVMLPIPRLLLVFHKYFKLQLFENALNGLSTMINKQIKEHQNTRDKETVRDMMDLFLNEIEETSDHNSSFYGQKGHYAMVNDFIDLFLASIETTSTSLNWTFFYLLHHPEMKQKIHEELDKVVGYGDTPRLIHKDDMNYTKAFLQESFRMSSISMFAMPHFTTASVSIGPYVIPKGTTILPGLICVHTDPDLFPEPHKFNPDRFLDQDGVFQNDEHVIPFSIGKRYCLGQSLAEKAYFLFFAGMMQKFDISSHSNQTLHSYHIQDHEGSGAIRAAPRFDAVLTPRKKTA